MRKWWQFWQKEHKIKQKQEQKRKKDQKKEEKKDQEQEQDDICRFETISLQDMVAKFEPNLGFEKSFISVLALKVISVKSLELGNTLEFSQL